MSKPRQERPSRRIVEAEDIAKRDFGVSVMAIVVLGKHQGKRAEEPSQPRRRPPADLGGMAPPDVKLPQREACDGTRPGDAPEKRRHNQIGHRSEQAVEEYRGIARDDRVVEVPATPVVVRAQVKREPEMLRNVIEERRTEISGDERDDESGDKRDACGDDV